MPNKAAIPPLNTKRRYVLQIFLKTADDPRDLSGKVGRVTPPALQTDLSPC